MAKKQKKKKAGLQKKKFAKIIERRKNIKTARQSKENTQITRLRKLFTKIPLLIFEQEIQNLSFDLEVVKKHAEADKPLPYQVASFCSEEVEQKFVSALEGIYNRFSSQPKTFQFVTSKFTLDFMKDNKAHAINELVVAKYCQLLHQLGLYTEVTPENVLKIISAYKQTWKTELDLIQEEHDTANLTVEPKTIIEKVPPAKTQEAVTELDKLQNQLQDLAEKEDLPNKELVIEDIETFITFLTENEITTIKKISPTIVTRFYMHAKNEFNPTDEDLANILHSLEFIINKFNQLLVFDETKTKEAKLAINNLK